MKRILAMTICLLGATTVSADGPVKFEDAVKTKIVAVIEPAEAKPGQTVTLKIKVELNPGWYTYPTVQEDRAASSQVNKIIKPEAGSIILVGNVIEPPNPKSKAEPILRIEKLLHYPVSAVYEYKAVISPSAKTGENSTTVKFQILVCNDEHCIPKPLDLKATVRVVGDPVPVEAKYKDEVEKAMKK